MNLSQMIDWLKTERTFMENVVRWHVQPPREGDYRPFPEALDERIAAVLEKRGIHRLYSHQVEAYETASAGKNLVVVTPTASGKTLCYNLPVLDAIARENRYRALYLFPAKALGQDQLVELHDLITRLGLDIKTFTFDGDTPQNARRAIRVAGHIVITNPDMLHAGILPHHTRWVKLFENLKYVVLDELHLYRGVFGSHTANVLRRLKRIANFYGSKPQFIFTSATIANPKELAEKLCEEPVELINRNGAPRGTKHFILYNPPVVNKELGLRKSSWGEAERLASHFIENRIQTIVFAPYRLTVEIVLAGLRNRAKRAGMPEERISGYRGGYLPLERRSVEQGLRSKSLLGVVTTNALELGIDIGELEVSILTGYPGTIASTFQQAGRAGRKKNVALTVLIANSSAMDQFLAANPEFLFEASHEAGIIDPNNFSILTNHLKCAAFELPFDSEERFGIDPTRPFLEKLEARRILRLSGDRFHWASDIYPASEFYLRSSSGDTFVVLNRTDGNKAIGVVDYQSAPIFLHPRAIYLHGGERYQVEELDWEGRKAYVKEAPVDYYTDAETKTELKVLTEFRAGGFLLDKAYLGEVSITTATVLFKKIRFGTGEVLEGDHLSLPPTTMHTISFWTGFPEDIAQKAGISVGSLGESLRGLANVLQNLAPLWVMGDRQDIRAFSQVRSPFLNRPAVFVYDNVAGGVGYAEKIFVMREEIFIAALSLIRSCGCADGCPSCVGPKLEVGRAKEGTVAILEYMLGVEVTA
jgi:DEAD/DEAH box helicase domain-containing protein